MGFITQIGGACDDSSSLILELKQKLQSIGAMVDHPKEGDLNSRSSYDGEVNYYHAVSNANFHTIANDGKGRLGHIDENAALEIMHAMLKRKPIVLLHAPVFDRNVGPFARGVIANRLSKLMVCNLLELDDEDARQFLQNITESDVNYTLTHHEETIIKSRLKAHFRKLLQPVNA
ncbi:MAG: hypothetical protein ACREGJ_02915 [Candidatus Saccharimonadales bacterium]